MTELKRVVCGYDLCSKRRPHHERPDEERGPQLVEVPWWYEGRAYCSMTCAIMGGSMKVTEQWSDQERAEAAKRLAELTQEILERKNEG